MTKSAIFNNASDSLEVLVSPRYPISSANPANSTPPLQLGVMASGSGTNFEAVAQAIANGQLILGQSLKSGIRVGFSISRSRRGKFLAFYTGA